jgi:hypothetical protein
VNIHFDSFYLRGGLQIQYCSLAVYLIVEIISVFEPPGIKRRFLYVKFDLRSCFCTSYIYVKTIPSACIEFGDHLKAKVKSWIQMSYKQN